MFVVDASWACLPKCAQNGNAFPTAMDNRWRSSVDISQDIHQKRAIRLETLSAIHHSVCSTIMIYH